MKALLTRLTTLAVVLLLAAPSAALADTGLRENIELGEGENQVIFKLFSADETTTTTVGASDTTEPASVTPGLSVGAKFQSLSETLVTQWEAGINLDMLGQSFQGFAEANFFGAVNFATINGDKYNSFYHMAEDFLSRGGFDGAVAAQAAKWSSQVGGISMPELTPFTIGELAVPEEALTFGMVFEEATRFTATDPQLLADIREGVGGADTLARWRENIGLATDSVNQKIGAKLPCASAFLAAVSGGVDAVNSAGFDSNCGACVTAGLYSQGLLERTLDPDWNSVAVNPNDGVISGIEYEQMSPLLQSVFDIPGMTVDGGATLKPNTDQSASFKSVVECGASKARIGQSFTSVTDNITRKYIDQYGSTNGR